MYNGKVKGMFAFGMNGVMIGPDTNKNINALKKADWLVVGEIYPDETSEFWRAPGITTDEHENDQYDGLPLAVRWLCRKRRQHDELRALGAPGNMPPFRLRETRGSTRTSWRRFSCGSATSTRKKAANSPIPF